MLELDQRRSPTLSSHQDNKTTRAKVYVVIVNWNGWADTIECLESVFRLNYPDFTVIVCDNGSMDGSLERIAGWANGTITARCANPALQHLITPPCIKPIPFCEIGSEARFSPAERSERLFLVPIRANLGFAGGNNVALRLLLAAGAFDYVWLLNNDTVVDPDALSRMVERMEFRPDAGICGSTLVDFYKPQTVQALGGSIYNRWTARGGHIGFGLSRDQIPPSDWVEHRMKYVVGASMLVRKTFLDQIGLLGDDYFLYFEEIDWATRARGRFALAYSRESIVYHKEGSSIGTARLTANRSTVSEYYTARNRILFTRKYFPYALLSTCLAITLSAVHRLVSGRTANFNALWRGIFSGLQ